MSLNIKDEKTHRLVRELAHLTGESVTAAVSEAIRERLERVRGKSNKGMAEPIMKIAKECGPLWKETLSLDGPRRFTVRRKRTSQRIDE